MGVGGYFGCTFKHFSLSSLKKKKSTFSQFFIFIFLLPALIVVFPASLTSRQLPTSL